jgi:hypothetical protein
VGITPCVKHRIARRRIAARVPGTTPRAITLTLLSTPIARPLLRRVYDRYMQTRTHPKHARGMPSVH